MMNRDKKRDKKTRLTLEQKKNIGGYFFTLPFTIGFVLFFLYPFIQSVIFSMSKLVYTAEGYSLDFLGLQNYNEALFVNAEYVRALFETVVKTMSDIPLILGFSFFAAILLNQKFRGRMLAREIFFLPVILSAGVVLKIEQTDYITTLLNTASGSSGLFFSDEVLQGFLMKMKLPQGFLDYIMFGVNYIPQIIKSSGIQILIFLAGLQSIPKSLYEASKVEGATGWEKFWKITFPLMSPLILVNIVYTIINSFTAPDNQLIKLIRDTSFQGAGYGVGTAMAWIYFVSIGIILAITIGIISRHIYYME